MSWSSDMIKRCKRDIDFFDKITSDVDGYLYQFADHEEDTSIQSKIDELTEQEFKDFDNNLESFLQNQKNKTSVEIPQSNKNTETPTITEQAQQTEQFHQNHVTSATNVNPVKIWDSYDEQVPYQQQTETPTTIEQPQQQYDSEFDKIAAETGSPLNVLRVINEKENCKDPNFTTNPYNPSTIVNDQGEVIQISNDNNILPTIPESGIDYNGNVIPPLNVNDKNKILKDALDNVIKSHPVLPDELIPLANALSINGVGIEKGKNVPNTNGVYKIKLFAGPKQVPILTHFDIQIDPLGSISNDGVPKIYINKTVNNINESLSIPLSNINEIISELLEQPINSILFRNRITTEIPINEDNLYTSNNVYYDQQNAVINNEFNLNNFIDLNSTFTLPFVVNGNFDGNIINDIIINKLQGYIYNAVMRTNGISRFIITDFFNYQNFKLVSPDTGIAITLCDDVVM